MRISNVPWEISSKYYCIDTKPPFIIFSSITLDGSPPKWYQYFLCGIKGVLETLLTEGDNPQNIAGLEIVVSGTVPQSAGLSSSSALVSAAALAASHAFKVSDFVYRHNATQHLLVSF